MLKPSCGTRCYIRATTIAKPPCTHCLQHAACGKRKPAPFRPRSDTWEHRTIRSEGSALYISPGRVLFAAQESLVLSTCGQNERFLLAYALRGGPFRRFFAHREPFLPNTALLWPTSREENARFGHDRLKRASFALCIAAHLCSYRSSSLNGAVEAWCDGSSVVSSGRRQPSSSRRAEGRLRCRPSSRGRPSRCPEGSPPGACHAACTTRARAWRTA